MKVEIGNAVLYHGDCREILPTLPAVDSLVTDPPYGMGFQSNFRIEQHDEIAGDDDRQLLLFACSIPVNHSRYVFARWNDLRAVPMPRSCITWVKNNWSMGDLEHEHARQSEIVMYWPGPGHNFPYERPTDVVHAERTANAHHPTEKPVRLMERVIRWTDGIVVDPFMGSGTTGVACANLGRPFVGIEIDPKHFETACRRIEAAHSQMRLFA